MLYSTPPPALHARLPFSSFSLLFPLIIAALTKNHNISVTKLQQLFNFYQTHEIELYDILSFRSINPSTLSTLTKINFTSRSLQRHWLSRQQSAFNNSRPASPSYCRRLPPLSSLTIHTSNLFQLRALQQDPNQPHRSNSNNCRQKRTSQSWVNNNSIISNNPTTFLKIWRRPLPRSDLLWSMPVPRPCSRCVDIVFQSSGDELYAIPWSLSPAKSRLDDSCFFGGYFVVDCLVNSFIIFDIFAAKIFLFVRGIFCSCIIFEFRNFCLFLCH